MTLAFPTVTGSLFDLENHPITATPMPSRSTALRMLCTLLWILGTPLGSHLWIACRITGRRCSSPFQGRRPAEPRSRRPLSSPRDAPNCEVPRRRREDRHTGIHRWPGGPPRPARSCGDAHCGARTGCSVLPCPSGLRLLGATAGPTAEACGAGSPAPTSGPLGCPPAPPSPTQARSRPAPPPPCARALAGGRGDPRKGSGHRLRRAHALSDPTATCRATWRPPRESPVKQQDVKKKKNLFLGGSTEGTLEVIFWKKKKKNYSNGREGKVRAVASAVPARPAGIPFA